MTNQENLPRELIISIIRHAQSQANADGTLSGITDHPLTRYGEKQAKELAVKLKDTSFTQIITSDLQRARLTAEEVKKVLPNVDFRVEPGLREQNFGDREGLAWNVSKKTQVGGETLRDVHFRARLALEDLLDKFLYTSTTNHHVALFTHGIFLSAFLKELSMLAKIPIQPYYACSNTGIYQIKITLDSDPSSSKRINLVWLKKNDTSHVKTKPPKTIKKDDKQQTLDKFFAKK